jgi:hypothetical protein
VRQSASVKVKMAGTGALARGFTVGDGALHWWREDPESRSFGLNAPGILAVPAI